MKAYAFIVNMVDNASSKLESIARSAGVADSRMDELNSHANKSNSIFGKLGGLARNSFRSLARYAGLAHKRIDRMNDETNRSGRIFGKLRRYARSGLLGIVKYAGSALDRMRNLNSEASQTKSVFSSLRGLLAGVFTIIAVSAFANKVVEARSEYEKFSAVLTNTFQSAAVGEGALNMLTEFAAKTPFALNELTGSFVKLVNRGFNPTMEQLTKMGDLAASQGKGFDQLTEAVLDAQTGEFERLKEFGIKASKAGDKITMSFKGITKVIDDNEASLRNAVLQYGAMVGVAGAMDAISKTLGGRISNLGDRWNYFLVKVGGQGNGILTGFVEGASKGISFLTDHLPQISKWFEILWGSIKPVVIALKDFVKATFRIKDASSVMDSFGTAMTSVLFVVDIFTTGLIELLDFLGPVAPIIAGLTAVWWLFNLAVAASPLGWIVYGLVAIIAAIGLVTKYTYGWTEAWQALMSIFKLAWDGITADFMFAIELFKFGFNLIILSGENAAQKIIGRFNKVGEAIKMALNGDLSGAWDKAFETVDTRAEDEMKKVLQNQAEINKLWAEGRITRSEDLQDLAPKLIAKIDAKGFISDYNAIKEKFNGLGEETNKGDAAYVNWLKEQKEKEKLSSLASGGANAAGKKKTKTGKKAGDTIVSGGTRKTNIYITIQKLQDDTKIYVSNTETGLKELGEKVQEVLLRSVNSINQMQTG